MITPSNVLLNWINELSARRDSLILSIEKISDNEKRVELMDEAYDIGGQIAKARDMLADINREITNPRGLSIGVHHGRLGYQTDHHHLQAH